VYKKNRSNEKLYKFRLTGGRNLEKQT